MTTFAIAFYNYLINYHWYIGAHTYDRIVSLLHSEIQSFLEGKFKHLVTDNGSNFVNAIKKYMSSLSMANTAEGTVGDQFEDDFIEREIIEN